MSGLLKLDEQDYVVTSAERIATPPRVLKAGDTFGVFDQQGDIIPDAGQEGLFHDDTRHLSRLELLIAQSRPLLLGSTISEDNVFTADMTNMDVLRGETLALARGELHIQRLRVLRPGGSVEQVRLTNHALHPIEAPIGFRFDADFADIFEVRGLRRERRGERLPDVPGTDYLIAYRGLDGVERRTRLRFNRPPDGIAQGFVWFRLSLDRHQSAEIELDIVMERGSTVRRHARYVEVVDDLRRRASAQALRAVELQTSNTSFNRWIRRSAADLRMMMTETPHGLYPHAGIPWYSTPFGRDAIITALQVLWIDPDIARGVLGFLADTQATSYSDARDAQPGKILHEMRRGEMAALEEVPFGRYYGAADATPLFVMLAAAYYERTADLAFIDRIWPNIVAALNWMEGDGDPDRDGFIEYSRRSPKGLVQQGWKDSSDSIFHADGSIAEPPIALCEIQGYAYAAWAGAARLAAARGDARTAETWRSRAERLRERFDTAFWCEELGTYALALDGRKRPCRVRTSNPGHCLFAGIVPAERAARVVETLMASHTFAGWGMRTVAAGEVRFNPMSYHNGSVWAHDTAIVATGMARYGFSGAAARILEAMFDLSQAVDLHRLPELICGFPRDGREQPTLYPVACAPQAWAAGAVFQLLAACLGLGIDARAKRLSFARAVLPGALDWVRITGLAIGDARVDLHLERHPFDVGVTVLRREGDVEIVALK